MLDVEEQIVVHLTVRRNEAANYVNTKRAIERLAHQTLEAYDGGGKWPVMQIASAELFSSDYREQLRRERSTKVWGHPGSIASEIGVEEQDRENRPEAYTW